MSLTFTPQFRKHLVESVNNRFLWKQLTQKYILQTKKSKTFMLDFFCFFIVNKNFSSEISIYVSYSIQLLSKIYKLTPKFTINLYTRLINQCEKNFRTFLLTLKVQQEITQFSQDWQNSNPSSDLCRPEEMSTLFKMYVTTLLLFYAFSHL